jgi:hypothetical protein
MRNLSYKSTLPLAGTHVRAFCAGLRGAKYAAANEADVRDYPVMAEGVAIDGEDDTDRAGHGRDRCADTACQSSAVATYQGGVLVVADR